MSIKIVIKCEEKKKKVLFGKNQFYNNSRGSHVNDYSYLIGESYPAEVLLF